MKQILTDSINTAYCKGSIEFIARDRQGRVLRQWTEPNIVKIFAKEILSHRMPHFKIWNPNGGTGSGAWEQSTIDPLGEFAVKYILLGASFDDNGVPLDDNDPRYYTTDPITGKKVPIKLDVGAEYDGELINAVPLSDPSRPLKKVEKISYEATFQPSGVPFLLPEVRALNNIVLLETTLRPDEYNGFATSDSDYFTITEVALAAGREIDFLPYCEVKPGELFLEGTGTSGSGGGSSCPHGVAITATAGGGDVITLDDTDDVNKIKEGDQIKIVAAGTCVDDTGGGSIDVILDQINPNYLVMSKQTSGRDIQLDRVPTTKDGVPISGSIGIFRNTLRIFSHRILKVPVRKSKDIELLIRWRLILS